MFLLVSVTHIFIIYTLIQIIFIKFLLIIIIITYARLFIINFYLYLFFFIYQVYIDYTNTRWMKYEINIAFGSPEKRVICITYRIKVIIIKIILMGNKEYISSQINSVTFYDVRDFFSTVHGSDIYFLFILLLLLL